MKNKIKTIFENSLNKRVYSIEEINDGFNNKNFLVNNAYVVKIPLEYKDPTLSFPKEKYIYDKIKELKLSEDIVYFDINNGIRISKFIHHTKKYNITPTNYEILLVSKKLKKLHNSKVVVPFGYMMFKKLKDYKKEVDQLYYVNDKYEQKIIKETQRIFSTVSLCLCHNDLVHNNLLFRHDDLFIIDWENGAMNNPYFDLASFISENNLSLEQKELFLSKYFGYKYNNIKRKRVDIFIKYLDILFYYWAMHFLKKRKDNIYKLIAEDKYKRILISQETNKL